MLKQEIDMTRGPILGKMFIYALPLMMSGALQMFYTAADNIVVGRFLGASALAAVGATGNVTALLTNFFIGLSTGANVLVSQKFGTGEFEKINKASQTSLCFGIISGLVVLILGQLLCGAILELLQTPHDIIDLSRIYLRIVFVGIPAQMVYNFGAAILHSVGDTKRPMFILAISGLLNLLLNLLLVVVFNMGVSGVASATAASQLMSAVLVVYVLTTSDKPYRINLRSIRLYSEEAKKIFSIGLPGGLTNSAFTLGNVTIGATINSFGTAAIVGRTAASNIESIVSTVNGAFTSATLTAVGHNYGAKQEKRILNSIASGVLVCTVLGIALSSIIYIFGKPLLGLFIVDSPEAIREGMINLTFVALPAFLMGINGVLAGALRAMGHPKGVAVFNLFSNCGVKLFWVFFILPLNRTTWFLYLCWPIVWNLLNVLYVSELAVVWKKTMKKMMVE